MHELYQIRPYTINGLFNSGKGVTFFTFNHSWPIKPRLHPRDENTIFKHERHEAIRSSNIHFWSMFRDTIELFYPSLIPLAIHIELDEVLHNKELEAFYGVTMLRNFVENKWLSPQFPKSWKKE